VSGDTSAVLIRRAREDADMTQLDVARRTRIQQPRLSQYETGSVTPSNATLARILRETRIRPSVRLEVLQDDVKRIADVYGARDVWVFGSCAEGTDTSDSDVDLLIDFNVETSTFDIVHLIDELQDLLGVPVDIVTTQAESATSIMAQAVKL